MCDLFSSCFRFYFPQIAEGAADACLAGSHGLGYAWNVQRFGNRFCLHVQMGWEVQAVHVESLVEKAALGQFPLPVLIPPLTPCLSSLNRDRYSSPLKTEAQRSLCHSLQRKKIRKGEETLERHWTKMDPVSKTSCSSVFVWWGGPGVASLRLTKLLQNAEPSVCFPISALISHSVGDSVLKLSHTSDLDLLRSRKRA
jgi:hypothetical protein